MICYACNKDYPQQGPEPFWICPTCKKPEPEKPNLRDFWTNPVKEQMRLSCQYGEPPEPLTDEEKQEMADCGC